MSYNKNTWESGDTITSAALNNMEDGIAAANKMVVLSGERYNELEGDYIDLTLTATEIFNLLKNGYFVVVVATQTDLEEGNEYYSTGFVNVASALYDKGEMNYELRMMFGESMGYVFVCSFDLDSSEPAVFHKK